MFVRCIDIKLSASRFVNSTDRVEKLGRIHDDTSDVLYYDKVRFHDIFCIPYMSSGCNVTLV